MSYLEYCSYCGNKNTRGWIEGILRYYCKKCKTVHYQNPKPAATLVCPSNNKILLVKRAIEPAKGEWCLPGGFIELNETPEDAAKRELLEETGLKGRAVRIIGHCSHFGSIFGDILLFGIEMEIDSFVSLEPMDDADDAELFSINKLPNIAFECHVKLVKMYKKLIKI